MGVKFRCTSHFLARVEDDLQRPHQFAAERVGFIAVRAANTHDGLLLLGQDYYPVADADYIRDDGVGALIGPEGLRKALEVALLAPVGIFHVHRHEFGFDHRLWFSSIDLREQLKFVPDFFKVRRNLPHGAIVLGPNQSAAGRVWVAPKSISLITEFCFVGPRLKAWRSAPDGSSSTRALNE